jgi:hypothetical protein
VRAVKVCCGEMPAELRATVATMGPAELRTMDAAELRA